MTSTSAPRTRRQGDPAVTVFDVTPDDATDLAQATSALNVASPGSVHVTTIDGSEAVLTVHPGHAFPIRARRVWATGTTATGIVGLA